MDHYLGLNEIFKIGFNGYKLNPKFSYSENWARWSAVLDSRVCADCYLLHNRICSIEYDKLHDNCRCSKITMYSIRAGTATINGSKGADWQMKYLGYLPEYYISKKEAEAVGWKNKQGNLHIVAPGKSIFGGVYGNRNKMLPEVGGRIWFEADINYISGFRDGQRILFSDDGLIFVTYDHYKTFYEII